MTIRGLLRLGPVLSLIGVVGWVGRHVHAGNGLVPPGEAVWVLGFLLAGAIRARDLNETAQGSVEQRHSDLAEWLAFTALMLSTAILPLLRLAAGVPARLDYELPQAAWVAGAALMAAGTALLWRAHRALGANWSPGVELRAGQSLVVTGVYRRLRHPIYLALGLVALAQPLLVPNWLCGALAPLAWFALCALRLPREEALMEARFGAAWRAHVARTGLLWPRSGWRRAGRDPTPRSG